jgi:AcrR family transcriptional regulator
MSATIDERILDAAAGVFATAGFHAASMERIADAAGVSRVTLHRRGVTKDAILAALVARGTERYRAQLWPALVAEGSARERLALALGALCAVAEAEMPLLLALQAQADGVFHEPGRPAMTVAEFSRPFERILRDGREDGTLAVEDPVAEATLLFNLVGWTYVHLRAGHGWPAETARTRVTRLALDGAASRAVT